MPHERKGGVACTAPQIRIVTNDICTVSGWYANVLHSPEVGEPLDELSGVVLVELDVGEEELDDGAARVTNVEEHELGFA